MTALFSANGLVSRPTALPAIHITRCYSTLVPIHRPACYGALGTHRKLHGAGQTPRPPALGLPLAPDQVEPSLHSVSVQGDVPYVAGQAWCRASVFLMQGRCRHPRSLGGVGNAGELLSTAGSSDSHSLTLPAGRKGSRRHLEICGDGREGRTGQWGSRSWTQWKAEGSTFSQTQLLKKKGRVITWPNAQTPQAARHLHQRDTTPLTSPIRQLLPTLAVVKSVFLNKLQETVFNSQLFFCYCH